MDSTLVSSENLIEAERWDFEYFSPEFLNTIQQINQSGWPVKKLKEIVITLTDGQHGYLEHTPTGIPLIRTTNVFENEIKLDDVRYIAPEVHNQIKRSQLKLGDVLLTTIGSIGVAAVVDSSIKEANINQNLVKITPNSDVNSFYLSVFLNSNLGKVQTQITASKSVVPIVNYPRLREMLVPLPPKSIQDRIAQIMQEVYVVRTKKLAEAEVLLGGIGNYIFETLGICKNLPEDNRQFLIQSSLLSRFDVRYFSPFYTELERIIEDGIYPTQPLCNICQKISNGLTPAKLEYTEYGYTVIKVANLTKKWEINWNNISFTSQKVFEKAKKAYIKNDDLLILSASHQLNYIGRNFAIVKEIPTKYADRCMAVGELIIVRSNHKIVLPEYLLTCFIIKPIQELVNRMSRGQTAHLYAEDLQHLRVPIPPIKVQEQIVNELNRRRDEAKHLYTEAENLLTESKARVERMILGEEEVT